jgi:hypothetical protein
MAVPTPRELELAAQLALLAKERDAALQRCAEADVRGLRLEEQIDQLVRENHALRLKRDALAQRIFGKKSEQLSPDQMQLLLQEMETPSTRWEKNTDRRLPRRSLRGRQERLVAVGPGAVKDAPEQWRKIGN